MEMLQEDIILITNEISEIKTTLPLFLPPLFSSKTSIANSQSQLMHQNSL